MNAVAPDTTRSPQAGIWHECEGALRWTSHEALRCQVLSLTCFLELREVGRADRVIVVSEPRAELLAIDRATLTLGADLVVIEPSTDADVASGLIRESEPAIVFCCYPEQAVIARELCSTEIVTFEQHDHFVAWCDVVDPMHAPESATGHPRSPRGDGSTSGPSRSGGSDRVVCTAGLSDPSVRAILRDLASSNASIVLSSQNAARRHVRSFSPSGLIAPAGAFGPVRADILDRAPPETRFREVVDSSVLVVGITLWGLLALRGVVAPVVLAGAAMGMTSILTGFAAFRQRPGPRLLAATAGASATALGLRISAQAPSVLAALEFFVVAAVLFHLLQTTFRWITSWAWRAAASGIDVGDPGDGAPRRRRVRASLAQRIHTRVVRRALGLQSCRWVAVVGTSEADVDDDRALLRDFTVLEVHADTVTSGSVER